MTESDSGRKMFEIKRGIFLRPKTVRVALRCAAEGMAVAYDWETRSPLGFTQVSAFVMTHLRNETDEIVARRRDLPLNSIRHLAHSSSLRVYRKKSPFG